MAGLSLQNRVRGGGYPDRPHKPVNPEELCYGEYEHRLLKKLAVMARAFLKNRGVGQSRNDPYDRGVSFENISQFLDVHCERLSSFTSVNALSEYFHKNAGFDTLDDDQKSKLFGLLQSFIEAFDTITRSLLNQMEMDSNADDPTYMMRRTRVLVSMLGREGTPSSGIQRPQLPRRSLPRDIAGLRSHDTHGNCPAKLSAFRLKSKGKEVSHRRRALRALILEKMGHVDHVYGVGNKVQFLESVSDALGRSDSATLLEQILMAPGHKTACIAAGNDKRNGAKHVELFIDIAKQLFQLAGFCLVAKTDSSFSLIHKSNEVGTMTMSPMRQKGHPHKDLLVSLVYDVAEGGAAVDLCLDGLIGGWGVLCDRDKLFRLCERVAAQRGMLQEHTTSAPDLDSVLIQGGRLAVEIFDSLRNERHRGKKLYDEIKDAENVHSILMFLAYFNRLTEKKRVRDRDVRPKNCVLPPRYVMPRNDTFVRRLVMVP